jgi:transposase
VCRAGCPQQECHSLSDHARPTSQHADGIVELKEFGTMVIDLFALSDWLAEVGITHAAMESTGESWKPGFNLLKGNVPVVLVHAAHVKRVPGRKTDKADAPWLVAGQRHPAQGQRDLRDLT